MARFDRTVECVEALLSQERASPDALVVVDHNEELFGRLRQALPEAAEVIRSDGEPGLSGARNAGIAAARGRFVLFVDDDAVPHRLWAATLLEPFERGSVIGTGGHAEPLWEGGERPAWFPPEFLWVVGCSYEGMAREGEVRNVLGCSMAFRREVFERVGGFDPSVGRLGGLPLGCEETELCIRARREHGGAIVMVEGAPVAHHVPADRQTLRYLLRRCFYEGVSKAVVRRLSSGEALASERAYTRETLPRAALRACLAVPHERGTAVKRLLAIVGGLSFAVVGLAAGTLMLLLRSTRSRSDQSAAAE